VTRYELRHVAASLANDAGVRLDELGHKDVRMVSQVYRHRIRSTVGPLHIGTVEQVRALRERKAMVRLLHVRRLELVNEPVFDWALADELDALAS
jgi:hypothetical protein